MVLMDRLSSNHLPSRKVPAGLHSEGSARGLSDHQTEAVERPLQIYLAYFLNDDEHAQVPKIIYRDRTASARVKLTIVRVFD